MCAAEPERLPELAIVIRIDQEVDGLVDRTDGVHEEHHVLAARTGFVCVEDLVLGRVRETIDGEIGAKEKEAPERVADDFVVVLDGMIEHEHGYASGDEGDTHVLVKREPPAVDEHVHEHDRNQFARFAEDHGRVINVLQGRIAKWRSDAVEERDLSILAIKRCGCGCQTKEATGGFNVTEGDDGRDHGLDQIQKDEELEPFGFVTVVVGRGADALLNDTPGQKTCVDSGDAERESKHVGPTGGRGKTQDALCKPSKLDCCPN